MTRRAVNGVSAAEVQPVGVANAGLVLASPFVPQLFTSLGLLADGPDGRPSLRDAQAVSRGVHALQYLVDRSADTPDSALALNKVLCGVPLDTPLGAVELTESDRSLCDLVLTAMISNWPAVRNSTPTALRETLLQREGKLAHGEGGWRLSVQRRTLDVLVDQLPWSCSLVSYRWMPETLHVSW